MTMTKRLSYLLIAGASAVSLGAVAGGEQKNTQDTTQSQAQPQAAQNQSPELVKQAQEKLSAAGHDAGEADGMIGPKTQAALKEFQQSKGLEPSGQLDRQTLAELGVSDATSASTGSSAASSSSASSSEMPSDKPSS